jgi:hypothetical protein
MIQDTLDHGGESKTRPNAEASGLPRASLRHSLTRTLLACGVVAGPLYIVVGVIQILIRPGFDIRRHELSLMSNGDLGWIQIGNLVLTGLLSIACAVGMRRVVNRGRAGTWGPLLIGVYGLGLIGAGAFIADPMNGFPPGTPAGTATAISWHGLLHFVAGAIGFLALIAACLVFARRFAALGQRGWAAYSAATGVFFLAAFFGIAAGPHQAGVHFGFIDAVFVNLAFTIAVVLGWAWISAMAARLMTELPGYSRGLVPAPPA